MALTIPDRIKSLLKTYTEKCVDANGDFRTSFSCPTCAAECRDLKRVLDEGNWTDIARQLKKGLTTMTILNIKKGQSKIREALFGKNPNKGTKGKLK